MKNAKWFAIVVTILAGMLVGCAGHLKTQGTGQTPDTQASGQKKEDICATDTQTSDTMSETTQVEDKETTQAVEDIDTSKVVLKVYSDATATDEGNPGTEYTLPDEQAGFMRNLFYDHERETLESPLLSIGTIEFRIGEDILSTSMGGLSVLDGVVDRENVKLQLSDLERQQLQEVIETYVTDLNQVP